VTTSVNHAAEIERQLLAFVEKHTKKTWTPDDDFFAAGAVSSMFAMQLVVFIESTFDVEVSGDDLVIDNFRTVGAMTALVSRLRGE